MDRSRSDRRPDRARGSLVHLLARCRRLELGGNQMRSRHVLSLEVCVWPALVRPAWAERCPSGQADAQVAQNRSKRAIEILETGIRAMAPGKKRGNCLRKLALVSIAAGDSARAVRA